MTTFYIAAYRVTRNFGGPEEGGWWYDSGNLVEVAEVFASTQAVVRDSTEYARIKAKYPRTDARYSVLGGEDYDVKVSATKPAIDFPAEIPHYE